MPLQQDDTTTTMHPFFMPLRQARQQDQDLALCAFTARQHNHNHDNPELCAFTARQQGAITAGQYERKHEHEQNNPNRFAFTARQQQQEHQALQSATHSEFIWG